MKNNFFKNYFSKITGILSKLNTKDIEKLDKFISEIKKKKIKNISFWKWCKRISCFTFCNRYDKKWENNYQLFWRW